MMKIILQEDVPNLGVVGDLVAVKDGYARNFLIPQGKAVFASVRSIGELQHQRRLADHRRVQATAEAELHRRKIESLAVTMEAKVAPPQLDENGEPIEDRLPKLFGTITNRDLARVLKDSDVKVEHRRITLAEKVSTVGKFAAKVRLDGGIVAELPFWVVPEGTEDVDAAKKKVEEAQAAEAEARAKAAAEAAKAPEPAPVEEASAEASEAAEGEAAEGEGAEKTETEA
jgi:large subunit ribosomal protein L9